MKKISILLSLILLLSASVYAQLRTGTLQFGSSSYLFGAPNQLGFNSIGSNVGFQFGKNTQKVEYKLGGNSFTQENEEKVWAFNFSPSIGYFISDHFMLGFSVGIIHFREKDDDSDEAVGYNAYLLSPNLRAYFKNEGKYLPYGEIRGGMMGLKRTHSERDEMYFLAVKSGHSFWLAKGFTIDIFAEYLFAWQTERDPPYKATNRSSNVGVGMGISYYLFGKSE